MWLPLGAQFSAGGDFALQGICGSVWGHFGLLQLRAVACCGI